MNYITLTPEVFFDARSIFSAKILSQYCQLPTTDKFIYDGYIVGWDLPNLIFPNIVKIKEIDVEYIATQFPDLEEVTKIVYGIVADNTSIVDIGNIKSADNFHMYLWSINTSEKFEFIKKHINIIDGHTLIVNGKQLNINESWRIDFITNRNYKEYGL